MHLAVCDSFSFLEECSQDGLRRVSKAGFQTSIDKPEGPDFRAIVIDMNETMTSEDILTAIDPIGVVGAIGIAGPVRCFSCGAI